MMPNSRSEQCKGINKNLVLTWNSCILASMGKDRNIFQRGMKVSNDFVGKLVGHKYEVKRVFDDFVM
jgi:hypothetical protein